MRCDATQCNARRCVILKRWCRRHRLSDCRIFGGLSPTPQNIALSCPFFLYWLTEVVQASAPSPTYSVQTVASPTALQAGQWAMRTGLKKRSSRSSVRKVVSFVVVFLFDVFVVAALHHACCFCCRCYPCCQMGCCSDACGEVGCSRCETRGCPC